MQNDQNEVTLIIPKDKQGPRPEFNCIMTITRKSAQVVFPIIAQQEPLAMSKCSIKEGRTHLEFKVGLSDSMIDILKEVFHREAFKVCLNNN